MKTLNRKIVLFLLAALTLTMFFGAFQMQPAKAAVLPLDPNTIPKYVTPLLANVPAYKPTNVVDGGGNIIQQNYYINVTQFTEQILPTGFPTTTVWGYGGDTYDLLTGASLGYVRNSPGPTFAVTRGIPTKITWVNNLTDPMSGALLNYLYPVDPTFDWANPNNIDVNSAVILAGLGLAPPYPPGYNGSSINVNGIATNPFAWDAMSPVPIVAHVHGAEVYSGSDGGPNEWFTPNGLHGMDYYTYEPTYANAAVYYYNNTQQESTIWYHDHAMGLTRINVFSGLAGYYIIKDPANTVGNMLPSGAYDVPLAIQDRSFYDNGSLRFDVDPPPNPTMHPYWVPEYFGDTMMVNGNTWPYLNVNQATYRFRLLDGCNARFLNLSLKVDGTDAPVPFTVVARDQGYLQSAVTENNFFMGPGMRAEVLVDFSGFAAGTNITLYNEAAAPFPDGLIPDANTGQVMRFCVQASTPGAPVVLPAALNPTLNGAIWPTIPAATRERLNTLKEVMGPNGPLMVTIDGQHFMSPITELPVVGTTEIWRVINPTADAHPMHWHLVSFQLVSRQPFDVNAYTGNWTALNGGDVPWPTGYTHPTINVANISRYYTGPAVGPDADEKGWLDTVYCPPGQVTTVIIRYAEQDGSAYPFNAASGQGYVWHCHIVDHEDNDMMRKLTPIQASQLAPLYEVIRGPSNSIQYRTYSVGTSTWGALTQLPGATIDSIGAAQVNGLLYLAIRGTDGSTVSFGSVNLTSKAFTGWTPLNLKTPSAPTLVSYGTNLYLVIRNLQNNVIYYNIYDTLTGTWGPAVPVFGGVTCDNPAVSVVGSRMFLVIRGFSTISVAVNNTLNFGILNLADNSFTGWSTIAGQTTSSAPTMTTPDRSELIIVGIKDTAGQVKLNAYDGTAWTGWATVPKLPPSVIDSPAIATTDNGLLQIVVRVIGSKMQTASLNMLTHAVSPWTFITGTALSAPTLTR